ncbi:hypothetical protein Tco_0265127 [Tanacetum coccineum]
MYDRSGDVALGCLELRRMRRSLCMTRQVEFSCESSAEINESCCVFNESVSTISETKGRCYIECELSMYVEWSDVDCVSFVWFSRCCAIFVYALSQASDRCGSNVRSRSERSPTWCNGLMDSESSTVSSSFRWYPSVLCVVKFIKHCLNVYQMKELFSKSLGEKQKEFDNVIKERDELKEKLEKWSNATLLQTEILNKQKVLNDKTCIGFGVEYSSSEESNNSSGDETLTGPLYENFKREKAYKAVPPPTGTIIPPRADVAFTGIDELAIRNKVINKQNSESSGTNNESCESKNSDDLIKNKEQTQNTVKSNIDRNKVIIEDWVDSDDEEAPLRVSEIKKQTVLNSETSSENKSPRSKDSFGQRSRRRGLGCRDGKLCFVCYSPDHFIKDCDLHERNLKKTQKPKPLETKRSKDSRSVWNNTSRVNHRNFSSDYRHPHQRRSFIPLAVLTREGLKSTVRSKMSQAVPSQSTASAFYQNTARPNVSKAVLSQSTARPYFPRPVFSTSTGRPYYPRMDNVRPRASSSSPPTGFFNTRTVDRPKSPKPIIKSKWVKKESTAGTQAVLPQTKGEKGSVVTSPTQTWRPKGAYLDHRHKNNGSYTLKKFEYGNPEEELKDHAIIDSGCSGSMTGDKDKLSDFKDYKGGYVAFGNDPKGGRITGKGTIKTSCIDFENVSYVKELKFNLLSVSQICDKKHNVLFTDTECLILIRGYWVWCCGGGGGGKYCLAKVKVLFCCESSAEVNESTARANLSYLTASMKEVADVAVLHLS